MRVALFGGAGYIGCHVAVALCAAGHEVYVFDNLSSGTAGAVAAAATLCESHIELFTGDVCDVADVEEFFETYTCDVVVVLAGLKSVAESLLHPANYYANNVGGCANILSASSKVHIRRVIFSSSATVYGDGAISPIAEDSELGPTSPYGRTKLVCEWLVEEHVASNGGRAISLRYFNPVGAHPSGEIGEPLTSQASNLFPILGLVALGEMPQLSVFGSDGQTPDGSGIRDFIHVSDLADAHLAALAALENLSDGQAVSVNVGTGIGTSVLTAIEVWQDVLGIRIPYIMAPPRPGDIAISFTDVTLAEQRLAWSAKRGLREMVRDHWNWVSRQAGKIYGPTGGASH